MDIGRKPCAVDSIFGPKLYVVGEIFTKRRDNGTVNLKLHANEIAKSIRRRR